VSAVPQAVDPDSLRAALDAVFRSREYRWGEASSAWLWLAERWQRLLEWIDALRVTSPPRYYLLLTALTVVLLAIISHLVWIVWRSLRPREAARAPAAVAAPLDADWYLSEARRLGAAGRFAEALAHRFMAALLDLESRRALQFHPSKTPAEYVAEARLDDAGRSALAALVASLYRHVFGGAPCDADQWRQFDADAALLEGGRLHAAG